MNDKLSTPTPRRHFWRWMLAATGVFLALAAGGAYNLLTLSRDATALRRGVLDTYAGGSTTRIQLSLDSTALGLVRAGLIFAPLPDEARLALKSVCKASVGVYELNDVMARSNLMSQADAVMLARGYSRIIGVVEDDETVLIYVPDDADADTLDVCLAVLDGKELVVVSARVDSEPLLKLIEQKLPRGRDLLAGL
ncbi:MAG: hypothetical protein IPN11_15915 [Opitutaceae bacterium]|nr:hypothetical protein [Opitutaceae bacterium]